MTQSIKEIEQNEQEEQDMDEFDIDEQMCERNYENEYDDKDELLTKFVDSESENDEANVISDYRDCYNRKEDQSNQETFYESESDDEYGENDIFEFEDSIASSEDEAIISLGNSCFKSIFLLQILI